MGMGVPFFYNESDLAFVNRKASAAGVTKLPFSITSKRAPRTQWRSLLPCLTTFSTKRNATIKSHHMLKMTGASQCPKCANNKSKSPFPGTLKNNFTKK